MPPASPPTPPGPAQDSGRALATCPPAPSSPSSVHFPPPRPTAAFSPQPILSHYFSRKSQNENSLLHVQPKSSRRREAGADEAAGELLHPGRVLVRAAVQVSIPHGGHAALAATGLSRAARASPVCAAGVRHLAACQWNKLF